MIAFEGKQDLESQIERKLRNYANRDARFIVLRDQDSGDCKVIKSALVEKCRRSGRMTHTCVRIACRELESFYLADLEAVEKAMNLGRLRQYQNRAKYRNPDRLGSPSLELKTLTRGIYQKVSGSRMIGCHLDPLNLRSTSFANLLKSIRKLQTEILATISTK